MITYYVHDPLLSRHSSIGVLVQFQTSRARVDVSPKNYVKIAVNHEVCSKIVN